MAQVGGSKLGNILKAKEDLLKTPEQLEADKRETIAKHMPRLDLDRKTKNNLIEMAEGFYQDLLALHTIIYELNERLERQKYESTELAERARQIEKGKSKTRKSNIVPTGLGGSVFNSIKENFPSAPDKISLFSRYERVTDRRTYKDRRDCFANPKEKPIQHKEKPKIKGSVKPRKAKNEEPEENQEE